MPRPKQGGANDLVSIADVGFGVSQTLPVVVALRAARPGQLVYIEQPEIHLHPRAQVAMARLLVNAAKRGVRVVAETHSSLILLAVQTLVAEGEIDPDLVGLNWFLRNEKTGTTRIQKRRARRGRTVRRLAGRLRRSRPQSREPLSLGRRGPARWEVILVAKVRPACWSSTPRLPGRQETRRSIPRPSNCCEFLQAVLDVCHRMVLTAPIREEWNKHQSRFARTWRVSMMARKKIEVVRGCRASFARKTDPARRVRRVCLPRSWRRIVT